jgi:hypothetical protein
LPRRSRTYDFYSANGAVQAIEIHGPYAPTGAGDTPSRRAIFVCLPRSAAEEEPCARRILTTLATRGYRRPVLDGDEALESLLAFYQQGRAIDGGDFETGIEYALSRLLIDARFLFRLEEEPADVAPGTVYAIGGVELASRLSFFLWSSIPDDELLEVAAAGKLEDPAILDAQVRRMLDDPRAAALVENFASQWLELRAFDDAQPEDPAFDADLRAALRGETERLFADIMRDALPVPALLDAPYTYLNERSAAHYGIPGVHGSRLRRVELAADSPRRGLLGQASILTATSAPNRTSPVKRGEWIIENLLGSPVPVPPPGVEADLSAPAGEAPRDDGRHRARPRKLRPRRPLARRGQRSRDRRRQPARRRHGRRGPYGPARRTRRTLPRVHAVDHGAVARVRARQAGRALRRAGRAQNRTRRGGARFALFLARARNRPQRTVPHEDQSR